MRTKFIIEGSDHLGKTTLAQTLSEELNIPVAHQGVPDFDYSYFKKIATPYKEVIFDRFHLGAIAYGLVNKLHHTTATIEDMIEMTKFLHIHGYQLIVLYASDLKWYRNWLIKNGKEEMYNIDQIMDVNETFYRILELLENEMGELVMGWDVSPLHGKRKPNFLTFKKSHFNRDKIY